MIIGCKECGENISDEARVCPHCGIQRTPKSEALQKEKEEIQRKYLIEQREAKQKRNAIIFAALTASFIIYIKFDSSASSEHTASLNNNNSIEATQDVSTLTKEDIKNGKGFPIPAACNYLSPLGGYTPNKYKTSSPETADYMCGTPYKNIGNDINFALANNIAYYVSGSKADVADTIKIIVNINQPKNAKLAREELSNAVNQLFLSAFEKSPPENIIKKISSGKVGSWTYGSHVITFKKIKWQSGKGFEYNFTINTIEYNFTSKNQ
ncbi:hypothetical protein [Pseudaeromonas pectinilytica]